MTRISSRDGGSFWVVFRRAGAFLHRSENGEVTVSRTGAVTDLAQTAALGFQSWYHRVFSMLGPWSASGLLD